MKKAFLLITFVVTCYTTFAQNSFPATGNVGVGISTAPKLLTVQGDSSVIRLQSPTSPSAYFTDIVNKYSTVNPFYISTNNYGRFGLKSLGLNSPTDYPVAFVSGYYGIAFATSTDPVASSASIRMAILSNGNVGVGTIAPASLFHVQSATIVPLITLTRNGTIAWKIGNFDQSTDNGFNIGYNAVKVMYINTSGLVGINTTDPKGYQLAVNGTAIANSMTVKLNANWPDYVLKTDYQLPTLADLKTFINQNHHLPGMPTEKEVLDKGLNLGEINKELTKKVEELTLYVIASDEKQKTQDAALKSQQEEIQQLKEQLLLLLKASKEK